MIVWFCSMYAVCPRFPRDSFTTEVRKRWNDNGPVSCPKQIRAVNRILHRSLVLLTATDTNESVFVFFPCRATFWYLPSIALRARVVCSLKIYNFYFYPKFFHDHRRVSDGSHVSRKFSKLGSLSEIVPISSFGPPPESITHDILLLSPLRDTHGWRTGCLCTLFFSPFSPASI